MVTVRKRKARVRQGVVVPLGRARSGVDGHHIQVVALTPGVAARGVWFGEDYTLLVSPRVPRSWWAVFALHLLERRVTDHDPAWEVVACTTANCAQARTWLAEGGCSAEASGL